MPGAPPPLGSQPRPGGERALAEGRVGELQRLLGLLADASRRLGPALELGPVLDVALAAMAEQVRFRGGTVCLVDEGGVYVAAAHPPVSDEVAAARVPVGTGLVGRVVATGEAVRSEDLDEDPRVDPALRHLGSNAGMRSYLAVPLVCLGRVIGALQVDSADAAAFGPTDQEALAGLAALVAGAIESARRYEEVLEVERLKSDFIARVSHELRTPLTIIGGTVQTLIDHRSTLDEATTAAFHTAIASATSRLGRLVDELLTVSSVEAGMSTGSPAALDVTGLLRDARDRAARPAAVAVTPPGPATAWADAAVVAHVLDLLVDNALRHAGDARLSADVEPGRVALHVDDTGPGVTPQDRARVFERFTRGADVTQPGMGLGLPLARRLAATQRGTLTVGASPFGGARFTLLLPS